MGTLPKSGRAEVDVDASPEAVYRVLADVTRTGEWSHETLGARWLDGASHAAVGARFRGRNRQGRTTWSRACEVVAADPGRTFAFRTVPSPVYRDSTIWTFELEPDKNGCRLTQRFEVVQIGPLVDRLFYALVPAHRDRTDALQGDLERLARLVEADQNAAT